MAAQAVRSDSMRVCGVNLPFHRYQWEVTEHFDVKEEHPEQENTYGGTLIKQPCMSAYSEWFTSPGCSRLVIFIYPGSNEEVRRCAAAFKKANMGFSISPNKPPAATGPLVYIGIESGRVYHMTWRGREQIDTPIANLDEFLERILPPAKRRE